jgi:hypothetical protein
VETPVVVALIAAVAGFVTSLVSLVRQRQIAEQQNQAEAALVRLRDELEERRGREARERDAAGQLTRYREPLLDASKDLFHRVRNIREMGFLGYLQAADEQRSRMALLGTLYRLGKYWGTVESLYGTVNLLAFERNPSTRAVADVLTRIGTAYAGDSPKYGGRDLMVWREEQKAIAELMQRGSPDDKLVIGFATFVERYDDELAPWFAQLEQGLRTPGIESSPRLGAVQEALRELVELLERDRM